MICFDNLIPELYKRREECCGCTACYAICSHSAISMIEDEEGFEYPQIDETKCVRCRICLKVCPIKAMKNDLNFQNNEKNVKQNR